MSKGKILIVEPDEAIQNMLEVYFTEQGHVFSACTTMHTALHSTHYELPNVILTEIDLPDKSGWDLCRELRTTTRTSHIPIIFLTHRSTRDDIIKGLELGADDYVTKPFELEELGKRVEHAIRGGERVDERPNLTGLPAGNLIEEHLRKILHQDKQWVYIDIRIMSSEVYKEAYSWNKWDKVTIKFADLLREVWQGDFIGHPGGDNFIVITEKSDYQSCLDTLSERFEQSFAEFYQEPELKNGAEKPVMSLSFGVFDNTKTKAGDLREITELAAEDRRRKDPKYVQNGNDDIVTHW